MGGYLTSALQGLGQVGSDLNTGRTNIANQKAQAQKDQLDQITAKLKLDQMRQQMAMQTPEGVRGFLRGVLQREPSDAEVQQYLGVNPPQPKAAPAAKNPYADVRVGTDGKLYGVNIDTGKLEPVASGQGSPSFPVPDQKTPPQPRFETREFVDPKDGKNYLWKFEPDMSVQGERGGAGNQWIKINPVREPAGAAGSKPSTPEELDAMINSMVAGTATWSDVPLRDRSALQVRADKRQVKLPSVKTNAVDEANKALSIANAAVKTFQQANAKFHYINPMSWGTVHPALQDLKNKAQDAAAKATAAGMAVPSSLQPYLDQTPTGGSQPDPNNLVPVTK